jgi:phenylacetate-CoA ligase
LQALQAAKLRALIAHAYRNVPYYRNAFDSVGIQPHDITGIEGLGRLPLLTKELIRTHREEMLSRMAKPGEYRLHATGGSTGEPISFYRSWEYDEYSNYAAGYRTARRAGWRPGERIALVWGHPLELDAVAPASLIGRMRRRVGAWLRDDGITWFDAFDASDEKMAAWVSVLRREAPRYILGYASALERFAQYLLRERVKLGEMKGVISTAETLYPDQITLFQRVFGGTVINKYGSREICSIATSCVKGSLHVNTDLVCMELVEREGSGAGKSIVITDLVNRAFPFIRYVIGDVGAEECGECGCGLPFPTLRMAVSREFENFVSPEGRVVHGAFFKNLMDGVPGVSKYRFRQVERARLILELKTQGAERHALNAHLEKVKQAVKRDFSDQVEIQVREVESIPPTRTGKHLFTVCELERVGAAGLQ